MDRIKVMIIDDSAVVRQTLTDILSGDPKLEVVAAAQDPVFGAKKMAVHQPDVIILDIEMPRMDGITFLKDVMKDYDIPVIICSSKAEAGSKNALMALDYGAVEVIQKPKLGTKHFLEESKVIIRDAVHAAFLSKNKHSAKSRSKPVRLEVASETDRRCHT